MRLLAAAEARALASASAAGDGRAAAGRRAPAGAAAGGGHRAGGGFARPAPRAPAARGSSVLPAVSSILSDQRVARPAAGSAGRPAGISAGAAPRLGQGEAVAEVLEQLVACSSTSPSTRKL